MEGGFVAAIDMLEERDLRSEEKDGGVRNGGAVVTVEKAASAAVGLGFG